MSDSLLSRLRSGEDRAWEELYDILAPDLRRYIARLGARDPDDTLGETMVHIVRDIHRFAGNESEIRPWAFRIAHNRVIDSARRQRSRIVEVSSDNFLDNAVSPAPLADIPNLDEVSRLLNLLTAEQKSVIWLRYVADFSLSETATITGRTPEAVAALTHRGMRTLRESLSP